MRPGVSPGHFFCDERVKPAAATAPAPAAATAPAGASRPRRQRAIDLLGRLDDMHAGERPRQPRADALPRAAPNAEPAAPDRRHVERLAPGHRREPSLAQQAGDLRARIGPAVAERIVVHARPDAAPVRHHRKQLPAGRQHAPDLAQQRGGVLRHFEAVDQQHAVDRGVRQRQVERLDQRGQRGLRGRPFHHALLRRHEDEAAFGLLAEQAEIRRRVAEPEQALPAQCRSSACGCRGRRNAAPPSRAGGRRNCADRRRRWTCRNSSTNRLHRPECGRILRG